MSSPDFLLICSITGINSKSYFYDTFFFSERRIYFTHNSPCPHHKQSSSFSDFFKGCWSLEKGGVERTQILHGNDGKKRFQ